jgi:MFS family permease
MSARTVVRLFRLDRLGRRKGVDDRGVAVSFTGRFVDELLSGAWTILTPTFRRVFGLSLWQVGLLLQVLEWVALAVEPVAASTIDHSSRRRLIAGGSALVTAAVLLMAAAPTYLVLLAGFALYGVGSGPLAHTCDVVILESFPDDPDRAYSRATLLDTTGALLGPAAVSAALFLGLSWRWPLLAVALVAGAHAVASSRATLPPPPRIRDDGESVLRAFVTGVRAAVSHREVRRALLLLLAFDLFEAAFVLKYVWLHDDVGLSEPAVALWAVVEQAVDVVALLALDRWLQGRRGAQLLRTAALCLVVLPPAWVFVPGLPAKVLVTVPLAFTTTLVWPLAKARSLTAEPQLAGAAQAVSTLFAIAPFTLLETWLASAVGIGPALAATASVAAGLLLLLSGDGKRTTTPPAADADKPTR